MKKRKGFLINLLKYANARFSFFPFITFEIPLSRQRTSNNIYKQIKNLEKIKMELGSALQVIDTVKIETELRANELKKVNRTLRKLKLEKNKTEKMLEINKEILTYIIKEATSKRFFFGIFLGFISGIIASILASVLWRAPDFWTVLNVSLFLLNIQHPNAQRAGRSEHSGA